MNNGSLYGTETLSDFCAHTAATVMWCRQSVTTWMNPGGSMSTGQDHKSCQNSQHHRIPGWKGSQGWSGKTFLGKSTV